MRPFHPQYIITALLDVLPYLWVTLATMAATVLFGGLVGLLLARAQIKRGKMASALAQVYIYITRCVPSIVMLFIVYYGLPEFLLAFGFDINGFPVAFFVIVTFSILFASNMAEVFRSAYEAVDPGQREAALCAGLSEWQAFYRIILPQCTVYALPNFANSLVNLMKEGSLSYTIGMIDVMGRGQLRIGLNQGSYSLETYIALAIVYWCLTVVIEQSFHGIELHLFKAKRLTEAA